MNYRKYLPYFVYLLFLVFIFTKVNVTEIFASLHSAKINYLLIVFFLNFLFILIRSYRWKIILKKIGANLGLPFSFLLVSSGISTGIMTPGRVGDLIRGPLLKKKLGTPIPESSATIIFERLFDLLTLMVLLPFALILIISGFGTYRIFSFTSFLVIFLPLPFFILFKNFWTIIELIKYLSTKLPMLPRFLSTSKTENLPIHAEEFTAIFNKLSSNFSLIAITTLITLAGYAVATIQVYFILRAIGIDIGIAHALLFYSFPILVGLISTIPFGLGSIDASIVFILNKYGYLLSTGTSASLLYRGTITLPSLLIGVVSYFYLDRLKK